MSKVSFRARALDANRVLPIYREEDLLDLNECNSINRTVPQMPTGMEKEEESEHHLQEALHAWQRYKTTENVAIPTPEIQGVEKRYNELYPDTFQISKQLFNMQPILLADEETIDYDMDSEDEDCLNNMRRDKEITPLQFETIMDKLEKSSDHKVVSLKEALLLIRDVEEELIIAVYDYWLNKRLKYKSPLILSVKPERRDGASANDPYVAFRKRTEKMQTRKNRKNDIQSFERMLTLRVHFTKLMEILTLLNRREEIKTQMILIRKLIYTARLRASDWDGSCLAQADLKAGKSHTHNLRHLSLTGGSWKDEEMSEKEDQTRRKRDARKRRNRAGRPRHLAPNANSSLATNHGLDSSGEEDSGNESSSDPDGPFTFKRMSGCHYHDTVNSPFDSVEDSSNDKSRNNLYGMSAFHLTSIGDLVHPHRTSFTGYLRQRVGRGGRRLFDRRMARKTDEMFLHHWDKEHSRYTKRNSVVAESETLRDYLSPVEDDWSGDDSHECVDNSFCFLPVTPFLLRDRSKTKVLPASDSPHVSSTESFRHSNHIHSVAQRPSGLHPTSHLNRQSQSTARPTESCGESANPVSVLHRKTSLMARPPYPIASIKKEPTSCTTARVIVPPPNNSVQVARLSAPIRINGANPIARGNEMRPPEGHQVAYMVVRSSSSGSAATPASSVQSSGVPPRKMSKLSSGAPPASSGGQTGAIASPTITSQQHRAGMLTPRSNNALHGVNQRSMSTARGTKRKRPDLISGMTSDGDD